MHWGHAESPDMVHWKQLPIALYPDSLGYIFSGSAVADSNNTSGFGKNGKMPLVAIFTSHDPKGERAGTNNFQNESIAYSLDNGTTWTKYSGNPVLHNPGIRDFRDPKVMWYAPGHKWLMTLATKDRITFYSSPDLKSWTKESEFGATSGAHGGVWECPDLFTLKLAGKTYWILIVNVNPGGPNSGSGTQYFVGQFNGNKFTPVDASTRWLDYGPDEYAGITWSNTGNRKIFLGWMSNWEYGTAVPTVKWRSAMTIPRELGLATYNGQVIVVSKPAKEINSLKKEVITLKNITVNRPVDLGKKLGKISGQYLLKLNTDTLKSYELTFFNNANEKVAIGYDKSSNQYFIDRSQSGDVSFNKDFGRKYFAPRLSKNKGGQLTLVIDASSVELFADGGTTVMTGIFFPGKPYNKIQLQAAGGLTIKELTFSNLKSIW